MAAVESGRPEVTEVRAIVVLRYRQQGVVAATTIARSDVRLVVRVRIRDSQVPVLYAARGLVARCPESEMNALVERAPGGEKHYIRSDSRIDATEGGLRRQLLSPGIHSIEHR